MGEAGIGGEGCSEAGKSAQFPVFCALSPPQFGVALFA